MSHHVIELEDVRYTYPDGTQALDGISFRIVHGESVGLVGANGAGKQTKVEVPPGNAGHGGECLPVEGVLQNRRLAFGCPGPHPMRSLAQPAFVDEDDRPSLCLRFFLMAGQMCFFQARTACSLRSRARPTGRWQLQPNPTRIFQTWPG